MPLTYLDDTADSGVVVAALQRDGAVAVTGLAKPGLIDTAVAEPRPQLTTSGVRYTQINEQVT